MVRLVLAVGLLVLLSACGKNTGVVPPYNTWNNGGYAPYPNNGYTNPQYPNYNPYQNGQNQFYPQNVPSGYSSRYTPWMPLHQWMNQDPYRSQYYNQMMNQWYGYANNYGYDPYNFNAFWLYYMPVYWGGTQYAPIYDYFNTFVYPWVNYGYQYPQYYDPYSYWGGYVGFSYDWLDNAYFSW